MITKKIKVLIIDDDIDLLHLLTKKLHKNDIECISATLPGEGLKKAQEYNPDLVLLDLNLPKMSGFGFLREFKHQPQLSPIPVVILTAIDDADVSQEAINLGAVTYLTKSCSDEELISAINKYTPSHPHWSQKNPL